MTLPRSVASLASALLLLSVAACNGGEGQPCQEADDCNDGLICCKVEPAGLSTRGTCEQEPMCDRTGPADSGPPPDTGVPEEDSGTPEEDSGTPEEDAGPEDAGAGDAAPGDAGPDEDAGSDAGGDDAG